MLKQGKFIVFEGIDGCGKSTQINLLNNYLNTNNIPCHLTKEPGGCPAALEIRSILLNGEADKFSPLSELLLFSAARKEHIDKIIKPKLMQNINILCDRFFYTTLAYQGYAGNLEQSTIKQITNLVINNTIPDVVILLDMSPEKSLKRSINLGKELRMEDKGLDFQKNARQGFLEIEKQNSNFIVINADNDIDNIHNEIIEKLKAKDII